MKKTAVVICPGRGSYNKDELGYLAKYHREKRNFISAMDSYRRDQQQQSISDLDSAKTFQTKTHVTGNNASALIYTCAMADFQSINQEAYDIIAVTGNSMGWYLALTAAGSADFSQGMHIVNTMGTLMHKKATGAQLIYPLCDQNWVFDPQLQLHLDDAIEEQSKQHLIFPSISLGSMCVVAGEKTGIEALAKKLPAVQDRFPLVLPYHAAFHTPLMKPISDEARSNLPRNLLQVPKIPLVDGRGHIWQPFSTEVEELYRYTFVNQVCETYDYSIAIEVACKEFAPDCLIILGPGNSLGAPTAQQLIKMRWRQIVDKASFKSQQEKEALVISMGIDEQRQWVVNA